MPYFDKACYADEPSAVQVIAHEGRLSEVFVRRNITRVETEDGERWECSEVQAKADITQEQAEAQADAIWQAEAPSGIDLETLAGAIEEIGAMVAEMMGGGE